MMLSAKISLEFTRLVRAVMMLQFPVLVSAVINVIHHLKILSVLFDGCNERGGNFFSFSACHRFMPNTSDGLAGLLVCPHRSKSLVESNYAASETYTLDTWHCRQHDKFSQVSTSHDTTLLYKCAILLIGFACLFYKAVMLASPNA